MVNGTVWTAMMPPKLRAVREAGIRPTEVLDVANPCTGRDMDARAFVKGVERRKPPQTGRYKQLLSDTRIYDRISTLLYK